MSFDFTTLITDRTQADVDRVKVIAKKIESGKASESELAEWNAAALKGAYNYTDLNRVGAAMQYVADRLSEFGYAVSIDPKLDWTSGDWPTPETMGTYLADLAELRSKFAMMQTTPTVPEDMEQLTYTEANNIEKILEDIDYLLTNTAKGWFYSGEVFSGEV